MLETTEQEFIKRNELHTLANEILQRQSQNGTAEHRTFTQTLLEMYPQKEKEKYTQDWQAYNQAQSKEKLVLMAILDELLSYLPLKEKRGVGRKPVNIRDKIFYLVMQSYNVKSSRRCISDLAIANKMGYVSKTPHFNTVLKILKDPEITRWLKYLVQVAGLPLQAIETDFAVDSSGFTTSMFGRWFEYKWGKSDGKERLWKKIHLTCGVRTNIITAVNITPGNYADSPQFGQLIKDTSKLYKIEEVSADKAYSSRDNLDLVEDLGGIPFIPFKANTSGRPGGSIIWSKMYKFSINYPTEFAYHYHKRSNVETTFHMLKRKFGNHLRSKTETGQTNEILAKCLCHNLCVLVQEAYELGISIDFKKCAEEEFAYKRLN